METVATVYDSGDKEQLTAIQSRHTVEDIQGYILILRETLDHHFSHIGLLIVSCAIEFLLFGLVKAAVVGKLLKKHRPHYFSLGRCHRVLLGSGIFPGSPEKEKSTQQVPI